MLTEAGFVSAANAMKTPTRIRTTAERKTALLVCRLILAHPRRSYRLTGQEADHIARA